MQPRYSRDTAEMRPRCGAPGRRCRAAELQTVISPRSEIDAADRCRIQYLVWACRRMRRVQMRTPLFRCSSVLSPVYILCSLRVIRASRGRVEPFCSRPLGRWRSRPSRPPARCSVAHSLPCSLLAPRAARTAPPPARPAPARPPRHPQFTLFSVCLACVCVHRVLASICARVRSAASGGNLYQINQLLLSGMLLYTDHDPQSVRRYYPRGSRAHARV